MPEANVRLSHNLHRWRAVTKTATAVQRLHDVTTPRTAVQQLHAAGIAGAICEPIMEPENHDMDVVALETSQPLKTPFVSEMHSRDHFDEQLAFSHIVAHVNPDSEDILADFTTRWNACKKLGQKPWHTYFGVYHDTALMWVLNMRNRLSHGKDEYIAVLFKHMTEAHPELIPEQLKKCSQEGETLIHRAVANSETTLLGYILDALPDGDPALDSRASGPFFQAYVHVPAKFELSRSGITPLETACIAPINDDISLDMVEKLIDKGADTCCYDADGRPDGTILHRLAKSCWNDRGSKGGLLSKERTQRLIDFFMKDGPKRVRSDGLDQQGYTAAQLAALLGNVDCLVNLLRREAVTVWQWGHKCETFIPMDDLDSGGCIDFKSRGVLELLVLQRHKHAQTIKLISDIVDLKWNKFGRFMVWTDFLFMLTFVFLATFSSFTDTSMVGTNTADIRLYSRVAIVVMTIAYSVYFGGMQLRARNSFWFRHMCRTPWGSGTGRLHIWQITFFRNIVMMWLTVTVVLLDSHIHQKSVYLDALVSILVFCLWLNLLRLMVLFSHTGTVVQAIPIILKVDTAPWMCIYMLFLFAFAGALRIALRHQGGSGMFAGTFTRALLTLEESTHGPDVRWREFVASDRPVAGVAFFLSFLWLVTIVLLNLLISMFNDTFATVRKAAKKNAQDARAIEVITAEKVLPPFLHERWDCGIGILEFARSGDEEEHGLKHEADLEAGNEDDATESTPLINSGRDYVRLAREGASVGNLDHKASVIRGESKRWHCVSRSLANEKWLECRDNAADGSLKKT